MAECARRFLGLALALLLLMPAPVILAQPTLPRAANPGKELVAVLEFDVVGATKAEAAAITDRLQDALLKQNKYTLVDRSQIDRILSEQAFQQEGCTTSECAVRVGRVLGVRKIVAGRLTKIDAQTWQLSGQLLDVETAETLKAETLPHQGSYFSLLNEVPVMLAARLSGDESRPAMAAGPVVAPPTVTPAVPMEPLPQSTAPSAPEGPVAGPALTIVGGVFGGLFALLADVSVQDAKDARKANNRSKYDDAKSSYETEAGLSDIGYVVMLVGIIVWIAEARSQNTTSSGDASGLSVGLHEMRDKTPYVITMGYRLNW
jgi:hypothetical protein